MSLIADLFDGVLEGTGWAAGVGIVVGVIALTSRRDSPLAKEVMKGYLAASDRVRELVAEAGEQMADLYAEARAEYESGASPLATIGGSGPMAAPDAAPARRRGRPPRAAASEGGAAETPTPARRRSRQSGAAGAGSNNEGAGASAPRRGRRPRAATNTQPNAA